MDESITQIGHLTSKGQKRNHYKHTFMPPQISSYLVFSKSEKWRKENLRNARDRDDLVFISGLFIIGIQKNIM